VVAKSGKNGCNLQGMSWMISLGYIPVYSEEIQAKGMDTDSYYPLTLRSLLSYRSNEANSISCTLCEGCGAERGESGDGGDGDESVGTVVA